MELYETTSYKLSKQLTELYSTSFSASSRLFPAHMRPHIYSIYAMVRLADEIVDSYDGDNKSSLLDEFAQETYSAIERGYSTNPCLHAFALTVNKYGIEHSIIEPFFESMRMDITPRVHTQKSLDSYIYGSAEVVGLMCLRVFTDGNDSQYQALKKGACALGSAYQKVNFLRDIAADNRELGRWYFAEGNFAAFDDKHKSAIEHEIAEEFDAAKRAIDQLPEAALPAVSLSYQYYRELLERIEQVSADKLRTTRIRVPTNKKLSLYLKAKLRTL